MYIYTSMELDKINENKEFNNQLQAATYLYRC